MKRICLLAGVSMSSQLLNAHPWYGMDARLLSDLGYEVRASATPRDMRWEADIYFAWWPTTGAAAALLATAKRRPFIQVAGATSLVYEYRGLEREFGFVAQSLAKKIAIRTSLWLADWVLAISEHTMEQVARFGAQRIRPVPLAIDSDKYTLGIAGRTRTIACVATQLSKVYLRRKQLDPVIRALGILRRRGDDLSLAIAGRYGDAVDHLRAVAREEGVSEGVTFLGVISEEDKVALLRTAFAYAQPTLHENFGVAIAEAMSCGTPVISSPVGSVPEVLADCGLYADPQDHEQLAHGLRRLLKEPGLYQDLQARGRARIVEHYTPARRRELFKEVLSSL